MFHNLKYVFYFESLLMGITVVLGLFAPHEFLKQLTTVEPTELSLQLARWYAVPFIPLTAIQIATLISGNRYALHLVMVTYLITDCVQFVVTLLFAQEMGWQLTHYVSGGTALLFIVSRGICIRSPERIGVTLVG